MGGSRRAPYLRDTLAVLAAVKGRPGDETGVLSLQEERLGLAVLEAEDLAVATDIDLTLQRKNPLAFHPLQKDIVLSCHRRVWRFHLQLSSAMPPYSPLPSIPQVSASRARVD